MPPVLNIYGGKITTYRRLAEAALEKLAPYLRASSASRGRRRRRCRAAIFRSTASRRRSRRAAARLPVLSAARSRARLVRAYGTRARTHRRGHAERGRLGRDVRRRPDRARGPLPDASTNGRGPPRTCSGGAPSSACGSARPRRGASTTGCRRRAPPARAPAAMAAERRYDARAPPRDQAGAQRDAHRRRVAHLRARHAEHPARADALRQDQPDAADGGARRSRPRAASSSTART